MKRLYLYTDPNHSQSAALKAQAQASGVAFTELNLAQDFRKHSVATLGPMALIDIDGNVYKEFGPGTGSATMTAEWNAAPPTYTPPGPPFINPLITPAQAKAALKTLLETDFTAWTANQQKQSQYLTLYGLFKLYLKTGDI